MPRASRWQYMQLAGAVLRSLPDDLDANVAQRLIKNQWLLRSILREALTPKSGSSNIDPINIYPIAVDYDRSIEDEVRVGRYDWFSQDITSEHFPTAQSGKTEVQVELIPIERYTSFNEAIGGLNGMGYRPANLHELLAFGRRYRGVQRDFQIFADSVWQSWNGTRYVAYLYGDLLRRCLGLNQIEIGWTQNCRFAAVHKE
ncbi:MAG: hypothetical protein HYT21_01330 [Candidatus Nealsonbacteria bacterium]|nr:hypothetical protein [Candidatus Nealsonbacteria bacterium]